MEINSDNYEEIMFKLLDKEFESEVEEDILFQIEKDPFLNFEWKQIQKTKVQIDVEPYHLGEIEFWKSLQKEEKEKALILPYTQLRNILKVAAVFLLFGILITAYLYNSEPTPKEQMANSPEEAVPNQEVPQLAIPKIADSAPEEVASEVLVQAKTPTKTASAKVNLQSNSIPTPENGLDTSLENIASPTPDKSIEIAHQDTAENEPLTLPQRYVVTQTTESIDIRQLAMLSDFEKFNITPEEELRINQYLSDKKVKLAQLLQNTKIRLKRKDDGIILLAQGKDESHVVWKISN